MKYSDHDGKLVDTEQMSEGSRPSGANYPSEGQVYSGGGSSGGDTAGCAPAWFFILVLGLPVVKLAEAFTNLLGEDSGYTTELLAGWAGFGGAAIIANNLFKKYVDPEATGVKWALTAIAVTGSLIYFANLTTPEQRRMKRATINYETDLKKQKQEREAAEAQALRDDPLLPDRRQRMEVAFTSPSPRMFGNQALGNLCGAFSVFRVTCTEGHATDVTVIDKIASKGTSVSIIDRARKSPLDLAVKRSSDGSAEHTLSMEGPGGNYAVTNYDPDVRAVAASVLRRFGLGLDILNRCSDPRRDFEGTISGNHVSCSASTATNHRMTVTISISGKEPPP